MENLSLKVKEGTAQGAISVGKLSMKLRANPCTFRSFFAFFNGSIFSTDFIQDLVFQTTDGVQLFLNGPLKWNVLCPAFLQAVQSLSCEEYRNNQA